MPDIADYSETIQVLLGETAKYVGLMCGAMVYLCYHYLIDVIASFAYAPAAYFLNDFLLRSWPGEQISATPAKADIESPAQKIC